MNWFVLSLISAATLSLREVSAKRAGSRMPAVVLSFGMNFSMFLMILALNVFLRNIRTVTPEFAGIVVLAAVLDALATLLYLSAIKNGDLSKTIPMLCFVPVIQLFVTPILVHENLSTAGAVGVLAVVSGSYLLNTGTWNGILSPVRSVFKDRNAVMMLGVACLWGVSSSFHKMGIRQTDALFWGLCENGLISMILFGFALRRSPSDLCAPNLRKTLWPGFFSALTVLSYYFAIGLGPVAYVSSVRRLGVLFTMLMGVVIFKESSVRGLGFAGGLIMIAGAVTISLFG